MKTTNLWLAVKGVIKNGFVTKSDVGLDQVDNTSDLNKEVSIATAAALVGKVDTVAGKGLSTNDYDNTAQTKLAGIQAGAEVNLTTEQTQDLIAAMFQGGTHNNVTFTYVNGVINVSAAGGSSLTQEEVEDIVGGVTTQGAGINVAYDDPNNTLVISLTGESFTTLLKNKVDGIEDNATADQTGAEVVTLINGEADVNLLSDALLTKLTGVEAGATANSTDAQLRDRSTHTGTQAASTISDFDAAADARITAQKAQNNGLASLDAGGKVPTAQLPAYVDDVLEWPDFGSFPTTGETGKIYIDLTDNTKTYRWSGSAYVAITGSPGSTDAVPEGGSNLYHTAERVRDVVLTGFSTATNAVVVATDTVLVSIGKLQAQVTARAQLATQNIFTSLNRFKQTTCPFTTITWSATIAPDASEGQAFVVTATGATTLNAPTNLDSTNFQSFQLEFIQDATGSRTLGFSTSAYEKSGDSFPNVTATANAKTTLFFNRQSNGKFAVSALLDVRSS